MNGKMVRTVFDTGADEISFGEQTAKKLGLDSSMHKDERMGVFAGGGSLNWSIDPVTLTAGNREFTNFPVRVIKGGDSPFGDITVGAELLRRTRILMDYKAKTMTILTESVLSNQPGIVHIPFEFAKAKGLHHLIIIGAKVSGRDTFLNLDTGGTFAFAVFPSEAKRLGLSIERKVTAGVGGGGKTPDITLYKEPVEVCVSQICESVNAIWIKGHEELGEKIRKSNGKEISGVVSHEFLSGKQVEYDLAKKEILIRRVP